jgi:hypothetical protein
MRLSESVPRNAVVNKISEDGNAPQCSSSDELTFVFSFCVTSVESF